VSPRLPAAGRKGGIRVAFRHQGTCRRWRGAPTPPGKAGILGDTAEDSGEVRGKTETFMASGSPNRALNSMTRGPFAVFHELAVQDAVEGVPWRRMAATASGMMARASALVLCRDRTAGMVLIE